MRCEEHYHERRELADTCHDYESTFDYEFDKALEELEKEEQHG